jgi:methylated-DNA-[protein]-cysteine S-methyltransferase
MTASYAYFDSPVGRLLLAGDPRGLTLVRFPGERGAVRPAADWRRDDGVFSEAIEQLDEYFAGERREFSLPLQPVGTPFQKTVWSALRSIPYGATVSYGELARRIGRPSASRAVGAANGANPLPIIVPCHRVIGADRSLTGFGGGLETKRFLLALEAGVAPPLTHQGDLFASVVDSRDQSR